MGKKFFLTNYFKYFYYFYKHLKFRVFVSLGLNLLIGVLDGVGLALFIPLFKVITEDGATSPDATDYDFLSDFILNEIGITPSIVNLFLLIFVLFTIKGAAKFLESYVRVLYQQIFMRKIRFQILDLFNELNFLEFVKADKGRIENTFSGEVNRVNMAYVYYFRSLQYGMLVLVYSLLAMGSDWKFTLTVIAGGIVSNFIFKIFYKRTKRLSQKFTEDSHTFLNLVVQKIQLFKYLKATGLNYKYSNKLKNNIFQMENIQLKMGYTNAIISGIREPLAILIVFSAIFVNVFLFNDHLGAMLLSLLLLYRSITYFIAFQEQWNVFLGVSGSIVNMQHFERELINGKEVNGREEYEGISKSLSFQNVSFNFVADKPVLSHINLEVKKNEILAIIGESGAGKSTLMNLATGLFKPTEGKVLIDGKLISKLDLSSYRNRLGYIVQDPIIFNDTVYNNITFWAEKTKENYERFRRAIDRAVILEFINNLPEKEDSILGNHGINISGGQRQRLAIARELYKEVDILFMDEATSSLDGETEAIIQNNVKELKGKYTLMIIAHRLATIRHADRIVVMHKGEIEAVGDYKELLSTSPRFRKMIEAQNL